MKNLIAFNLENGETIFVENMTSPIEEEGFQQAGDAGNRHVVQATETFESTIKKIKPAAIAIADCFKSMAPNELELEFGLKLTAEAGVIISSISSEVNFNVKMTWKNK